MIARIRALSSSIGKKQLMALTGLALCGFLVTHLAGNFLLFLGPAVFDAYAGGLESRPWLVIPAEIVLLAIFGCHLYLALRVSLENRRARPRRYEVSGNRGKITLASRTMVYSGIVILVFIVLHVALFKFGERPTVTVDGTTHEESLYWLVVRTFQSPFALVWYVVAVCVVGMHVFHGVQSALRSFGLNNARFDPVLQFVSSAFGIAIALGYSSLPVFIHLFVVFPQAPTTP